MLVIVDEPGIRMGIEKLFDGRQFELRESNTLNVVFETATTGSDGVEKILNGRVDILFLGYKLPDMNGFDIIEMLGEHSKDLVIIMIIADASIEVVIEATHKGAYDFLSNPFTPDELLTVTHKAVERILLTRKNLQLVQDKEQARSQFVRILGHELKAPLSVVEGYLDLMKAKTLGNDLENYTQFIERSLLRLQQMRKLITDLLDMNRTEPGKKDRNLTLVSLRKAAENAIELATPAANTRSISITLEAIADITLMANIDEIDMMLNNLISNAVKYNRDSGRVTVKIEENAGEIRIKVTDTGIGMSPEEQQKLFKEFSRIKNSKTTNILGSGLGLSIVKRLAEIYEGKVEVESKPDKGSTFTLKIHSQQSSQLTPT